MKSCSECFHHDVWADEEICSYIQLGLADLNQDHWLVRTAFRMDDPSICPAAKEKERIDMKNPYSSQEWRKLRKAVLAEQPLCEMCQKVGVITAANTVDHIVPHKGDVNLFWSRDNLQALCSSHHSSQKQSEEKGGPAHDTACDVNGDPIDVDHPWNQRR